jgi:hypothetical protein
MQKQVGEVIRLLVFVRKVFCFMALYGNNLIWLMDEKTWLNEKLNSSFYRSRWLKGEISKIF